ncbi:hypothetical protein N656DRAFT_92902 [Canariomyces notabilis]|uniref:Uncharacterized protein n=1 Tax=Canariomyces notabilis TaxID=2074819 RepID=A0AAN6TE13_9PEZI|nr:hypothetical protein N656DRAFT_92902 [Canariomyces arenarius]
MIAGCNSRVSRRTNTSLKLPGRPTRQSLSCIGRHAPPSCRLSRSWLSRRASSARFPTTRYKFSSDSSFRSRSVRRHSLTGCANIQSIPTISYLIWILENERLDGDLTFVRRRRPACCLHGKLGVPIQRRCQRRVLGEAGSCEVLTHGNLIQSTASILAPTS